MSGSAGMAEFHRRLYGDFPQEHRAAGSLGVTFVRVESEPHEMVDPPVPDLVIQLVRKGEPGARYHLGDRWLPINVGSGSLLVSPPETKIAYRVPDPHELLMIALPAARLVDALGEVAPDPAAAMGALYERPLFDPTLFALGHRMWEAAVAGDAASALLVDSAALTAAAMLLRRAGAAAEAPAKGPSERVVGRVAEYVEAHLAEPLGLADLAAVACLSPFHFHRAFRDLTGLTPHRFVQARRVERARALLATDMALAQVALATGFASQSHFGEVFKAHTGATPGAFRAEAGA